MLYKYKMKSEKGLTLISTIILVVIIALITFCVVYFVRIQINKEKAEDNKTNILSVEAKIQSISAKYLVDKKEDVLVGTKLSDMSEDTIIKSFLEKNLFDPNEKDKKYYVLNQQNINDMGLSQVVLEKDSYYIVEYTENKVYYTAGYTDENAEVHFEVEVPEVENKENTSANTSK